MRQLVRPAVRLPTLLALDAAHGAAWKEAGVGGPKGDSWNNPDVRGALYAMHGRACAYCQQYLPENDRGDVEHFRPKSIYRWLAYTFDNYLLSCGTCNRVLKRDRFPLPSGAAPVIYAERHSLAAEPRLLLDPASDPTERWIDYDIFSDLCPAIASPGSPPSAVRQTEATIAFFRLNGRPRLVQDRLDTIDRVRELLEGLDLGRPANEAILRRLSSRYAKHGSVVRKVLARARPALIPTPTEELALLVDELCADIAMTDRARPRSSDRGRTTTWERMRWELLYALAVLWRSPPSASPDDVAAWLDANGRRQEVMPFFYQLESL